jgi:2-dehydropantoate 2-reductase
VDPSPPQRVAVVGAGAVGSFFGAMLARAGHAVTLIARPAHVAAIERAGLRVERSSGEVETLPIGASVDLAAVRGAELVLFCVKSTDSDAVAAAMAPHLADGALVLSLQNGVENAATIARHVGALVVPAVVYVATALPEPGVVRHYGRGDLVIGPRRATDAADAALAARLQAVADVFAAANVPVKISPDVMAELWSKLMVNCAYNAISGLAQVPYGRMAALPEIRTLQRTVVQEVVAVAAADGVALPLERALAAMEGIAPAMPGQLSSTAQDMARGKPSEIDHLNGFVARRGGELGVPTPANQALHALVKLVESKAHG